MSAALTVRRDPESLAFGSSGGPIDYYVIYGASTRNVVERYTNLTMTVRCRQDPKPPCAAIHTPLA
jgi:hypothetical protein